MIKTKKIKRTTGDYPRQGKINTMIVNYDSYNFSLN